MLPQVLLIEAGGDEPIASAVPGFTSSYWGRDETDWNYVTVPQEKACLDKNGICPWVRGKMLGKSSFCISRSTFYFQFEFKMSF